MGWFDYHKWVERTKAVATHPWQAPNWLKVATKPLWWYLGAIYLMFGIGVLPWMVFQFWDNTKSGVQGGLDWERQPEAKKSDQRLMYSLAHWSKPNYEYAMKCFAK